MSKISCLGPAGSYSSLAAKTLCEGGEVVLCTSFDEVVAKLERGETNYAVIPIENSIQGGVLQNLDLLEASNVFAEEELVLKIDHRLVTKKGVKLNEIQRVYSHEQALGQCSRFLKEHLPAAQGIFTSSTAESLQRLDEHSAGIVGAHIQAEGLEFSAENIADNPVNYTRFLRLCRSTDKGHPRGSMIFLFAVLNHAPGTLCHLLRIFSEHGRNLTRIESRPMKGAFGEYRFFIELEGDITKSDVREMLGEVELFCAQFRVLGVYEKNMQRT